LRYVPVYVAASAAFLVSSGCMADTVGDIVNPPSPDAAMEEARTLLQAGVNRTSYVALEHAQEAGSGEAYRVMGDLYARGDGIKPVSFIADDLYEIGSWYGDPEAMFKTGMRLVSQQRGHEGWPMVEAAADLGHPMASLEVARRDFSVNYVESAQKRLKVAVDAGIPEALHMLAEHYEKGSGGLSRSYQDAFAIYYALAKEGDAKAMQAIGYYFVRGLVSEKDEVAAAHWYHEAAKYGNPYGMKAYAWMAENGVGMTKDVEEAAFFKKAASQFNDASQMVKK